MLHRLSKLLLLLFVPAILFAQGPYAHYNGICGQGGVTISTATIPSTNAALGSFPGCTVSVYISGTTTLATLYSNQAGTSKANPFTADITTGRFDFFALTSFYDVQQSQPSQFTTAQEAVVNPGAIAAVLNFVPASEGGGTIYAQCTQANALNVPLYVNFLVPVTTSNTCVGVVQFGPSGSVEPSNGMTVTYSLLANSPLTRNCNMSLGGSCIIHTSNNQVYPEWWCNVSQGTATDDAICINAAINNFGNAALGTNLVAGPTVVLSGGYSVATSIIFQNKSIKMQCGGMGTTKANIPACYIESQAGLSGSPMVQILNSYGTVIDGIRFIGDAAAPPSCAVDFNQQNGSANELNVLRNFWIGYDPFDTITGQEFTVGICFDGINADNDQNLIDNGIIYGVGIGIQLIHGQYILNEFNNLEIFSSATCAIKSGTKIHGIRDFFFGSGTADLCGTFGTAGDGNPQFHLQYWGSEGSYRLADFSAGGGSYGYLEMDDGYFLENSSAATDGKFISGITASTQAGWSGIFKNFNLVVSGYQAVSQTTTSIAVGSTTITLVSGTGVAIGQHVTGVGIPYGATVTGGNGTSWTISGATTQGINNQNLNFYASGVTPPVLDISHNGVPSTRIVLCDLCSGMDHNMILWSSAGDGNGELNYIRFVGGNETWMALGNSVFSSTNPDPLTYGPFTNISSWKYSGASGTPTLTSGSGAGSGASCQFVAHSDDSFGGVVCAAGTSPAANSPIVVVTFANPVPYLEAHCVITPNNAAANGLTPPAYIPTGNTTSFTIQSGAALGSNNYGWTYHCGQ